MRMVYFAFWLMFAGLASGETQTLNADFEFSHLTECMVLPGDCIEIIFDPNLNVTLLDKNGKQCTALTGPEAIDWEEAPATLLLRTSCNDPYNYELAIVAAGKNVVKNYEILKFEDVPDPDLINQLNEQIWEQGLFDLAKAENIWSPIPVVKKFPHPSLLIYLVKYDSTPGPLFVVTPKAAIAVSDVDECATAVKAFRLNDSYYLEYASCGCGTDACGWGFINMTDLLRGLIAGNG